MRMNKVLLGILGIVIFCGIALYQPFKTEQVYQRKIKLSNTLNTKENSISDTKMIQLAESVLEKSFGTKIEQKNYAITVEYESSQTSVAGRKATSDATLTYANIIFKEKKTDKDKYMVVCDTSTGEILMLMQQYESPLGDEYLPIEVLESKARTFITNTMGKKANILYYDNGIKENTYSTNVILKDSTKVTLYLDAFDGTVIYFLKQDN